MFIHYLKVALRNLSKYKTQTLINVISIGLSISIFALISTIMLNIKGDSLRGQEFIDDVAIMYLNPNEKSGGMSFGIINSSDLRGHQFRTIEKIFIPDYKKKSLTINGDEIDATETYGLRVDSTFLEWCGYESAVTHKPIKVIEANNVIISRSLGDKLFGDYRLAIGKRLNVQYTDQTLSVQRQFVISDVLTPFPLGEHKIPHNIGIFYSDAFASDNQATLAYILVRSGTKLQELAEELSQYMGIPATEINIWRYKAWYNGDEISIIISRVVVFILYLFVIVSLSSALRQWLQLFRLRNREIAIRNSLGGKKMNTYCMFIIEELISIAIAILFSVVCIFLASSFLENNFYDFLEEINFNKSRVFMLTAYCYLSIIIICLIVDYYAVKTLSPDKDGLSLQMKPSKHKLRNIGISVQLVICIVFLSIATALSIGFNSIKRQLGIPADIERYETGLLIRAERMSQSQIIQIQDGLDHLDCIDKVLNYERTSATVMMADSTSQIVSVLFQENDDVAAFYDLHINYLNSNNNPQRSVFVDNNLKEKMIATGDWNTRKIIIDGIQYDISGWYEMMPFISSDSPSIIINDVDKYKNTKCDFYILPKAGMDKQAKNQIKELVSNVVPDRLDVYSKDLYIELLGGYNAMRSLRGLIYIILGICMMTTISTIYSAISLDTRRRRKEMALRKINGAKPKDICRIFAKIYFILIGVSVCVAVPISILVINGLNETFYLDTAPIIPIFIALVICTSTVIMTLIWKIRDIMRVDPVTYLKD